ncbi:energy transducer TonB [Sphingomonas sp.]|jgi:protein TonB|uniref:energy transducer TonB n=1 Tax=Sphingomonas sp. TaxID=28214 RepID=UPI002DE3D498|nr:energy transducer TonB [Sphingomonas sp.]
MALYDASEMRIVDGIAPVVIPSRYGERRRTSWPALGAILGLHLMLVAVLDLSGVLPVRRAPSELKVIQLSLEMAPPPVVKAELPQAPKPQPEVQPQAQPQTPRLDAPPPIVAAPVPAPVQVAVAPAPPPPAPVASGPVRVSDLDAKAVTVIAPKYPIESRRKREQGTVVLAVSVTPDGGVSEVRVAKSSGFERLDKAALDAVRRWRWSPTMRDGVPVEVRGTVDIPFILQG